MNEFVRLKSGVAVPEKNLLEDARRISSAFDSYPEALINFVLASQHDFDEVALKKYLADEYYTYHLEHTFELHVGPVPERGRLRDRSLARTALAINMIAVSENDDDLEGYLQEPLASDREILGVIFTPQRWR